MFSTLLSSESTVASVELVREVAWDDVVDAVRLVPDSDDVDALAVWLELLVSALSISLSAELRSVRPWPRADDDVLESEDCSEVRKARAWGENWSDCDDCCRGGGGGGGAWLAELPAPCTFCPSDEVELAEVAALDSRELSSCCRVCSAVLVETLDICTIVSFRAVETAPAEPRLGKEGNGLHGGSGNVRAIFPILQTVTIDQAPR